MGLDQICGIIQVELTSNHKFKSSICEVISNLLQKTGLGGLGEGFFGGKYLPVAKSELSILSNSILLENLEKETNMDVNSLYSEICMCLGW